MNHPKFSMLGSSDQIAPLRFGLVPSFLLSIYICQTNSDLFETLNLTPGVASCLF